MCAFQPTMGIAAVGLKKELYMKGGEFLLSLGHPYGNTSATEAYLPNVKLCKETLLPLGIGFREADAGKYLPFNDAEFDIGALVWFAHIIEWEFPGFSVDRCKDGLLRAQKILEKNGLVEGRIYRFLLVLKKNH